jgi:HPt (histidine-containing phosphotransfer) domain-containing protein
MMGSAALADRMLNRFLDTADADCDLMESTVRLGDKAAIASAAHRHKGTAQTLAAPRVARLAGELEQRANSESTAELLAMVDQLRTLHQEIRAVVEDGIADREPLTGGSRS